MNDHSTIVFGCPEPGELITCSHEFSAELPPEMKSRFREVFINYLTKYSNEDVFTKLNGRTAAAILSDEDSIGHKLEQIASGELEGMEYKLYKGPCHKTTDHKGENDNSDRCL